MPPFSSRTVQRHVQNENTWESPSKGPYFGIAEYKIHLIIYESFVMSQFLFALENFQICVCVRKPTKIFIQVVCHHCVS